MKLGFTSIDTALKFVADVVTGSMSTACVREADANDERNVAYVVTTTHLSMIDETYADARAGWYGAVRLKEDEYGR